MTVHIVAHEQQPHDPVTVVDWNDVMRRHTHRVVISLMAMGVRCDKAKELAQEAWMKLMKQQQAGKLDRFDFPGLAISQARFLALQAARSEGAERRHLVPLDTERMALVDLASNPERRVFARQQLERVGKTIAECSPTAQRVFRLMCADPDLPHATIADEVGLSLQRVRQVICEVRKKLREALEEDGR